MLIHISTQLLSPIPQQYFFCIYFHLFQNIINILNRSIYLENSKYRRVGVQMVNFIDHFNVQFFYQLVVCQSVLIPICMLNHILFFSRIVSTLLLSLSFMLCSLTSQSRSQHVFIHHLLLLSIFLKPKFHLEQIFL